MVIKRGVKGYKKKKKITKPILERYILKNKMSHQDIAEIIGANLSDLKKWIHKDVKIPAKYKSVIKLKLNLELPDSYFSLRKSDLLPCFRDLFNEYDVKADLARHLGITDAHLTKLICGKRSIPEWYAKIICEYFKGKIKLSDLNIAVPQEKATLLPCFRNLFDELDIKRDLERHLKIKRSCLSAYITGKLSIPRRHAESICEFFKGKIKISDLNITKSHKNARKLLPCFKGLFKKYGTKADLARFLGIKESALSSYILGQVHMPEWFVEGVCEYFNGKIKPSDIRYPLKHNLLPCFKNLLHKRGSRSDLARYLKISPSYLWNIIHGTTSIPEKYAKAICVYFKDKVKLSDLQISAPIGKFNLLPCFRGLLDEVGNKTALAKYLKIKRAYLYLFIYGRVPIPEKHARGICEYFKGKVKPSDLILSVPQTKLLLPCFSGLFETPAARNDLARFLKIDRHYLDALVSGKIPFPRIHAKRICEYFNGNIKLGDLNISVNKEVKLLPCFENLLESIDEKRDLARYLKITYDHLFTFITGKSSIPRHHSEEICEYFKGKIKLTDLNITPPRKVRLLSCFEGLLNTREARDDLAKHLKVTPSCLYKLVSGEKTMPKRHAKVICEYFKGKVKLTDLNISLPRKIKLLPCFEGLLNARDAREDLARHLKITPKYVRDLVSGHKKVSEDHAKRICEYFEGKVKVSDLDLIVPRKPVFLSCFENLLNTVEVKKELIKYLKINTSYFYQVISGKMLMPERYSKRICKYFEGKVKLEDLNIKIRRSVNTHGDVIDLATRVEVV